MKILLLIFKFIMNFIYCFFKLFKTNNNKVLFISRQSNEITIDFKLLCQKLEESKKNYKIVVICKKLDNILKNPISYVFFTLKTMYHISTSKVCVIDSYSPLISILKQKKSLKVLQIWHSLAAIKQFGYQTLDKKFGRKSKLSYAANMHKNYDLIISGSDEMIKYFMKAFNYPKNKFVSVGLPRIDYLLNENKNLKEEVKKKYPKLNTKKVILYVPTFRKDNECSKYVNDLINEIDFEKYNLIIKSHPNQILSFDEDKIYTCNNFSAIELLPLADYVITDYSGIAVEAAVLNKKTYYYLYDYEEYKQNNGLNIDIYKEMPGYAFKTAKDLLDNINKKEYDMKILKKYKDKYITNQKGNSTELIALIIDNWCKEVKK